VVNIVEKRHLLIPTTLHSVRVNPEEHRNTGSDIRLDGPMGRFVMPVLYDAHAGRDIIAIEKLVLQPEFALRSI
jgi:hypothetical protein